MKELIPWESRKRITPDVQTPVELSDGITLALDKLHLYETHKGSVSLPVKCGISEL